MIYGSEKSRIVGYSWYEEKEYRKVIENSDDDLDVVIGSFAKWKENAHKRLDEMENRGFLVFKVNVKFNELNQWLKRNQLQNTSENRERYVDGRLRSFLENPIVGK